MQLLRATLLIVGFLILGACQSPLMSTFQNVLPAIFQWRGADSPRLNPSFSYIRLEAVGQTAFLALGMVESHGTLDKVEYYFSGEKEVLRLHRGRIVGLSGSTFDWRVLPRTGGIPELTGATRVWERGRDVEPGGMLGIKERMTAREILAPSKSNLRGLNAQGLRWFEESSLPLQPLPQEHRLPPSRYAVDRKSGAVVYAEECVKSTFCLSWQRWPAK